MHPAGDMATLDSSSRPKASFETMPPEILNQIWGEKDLIKPADVAICRKLLPFAQRNAYRSLHLRDDISLAALGETLAIFPRLGPLIVNVEVAQSARTGSSGVDEFDGAIWLVGSWVKAFEAMVNVESVSFASYSLTDFLSPALLKTTGFANTSSLKLASSEDIPFADLKHIHLIPNLESLAIASPMKYQVGRPSGMFQPGASKIAHLTISAEPHAAEFTSWMEHLSLTSLDLRTGTSDLSRVIHSLDPSTRHSLRNFNFSTSSYLQHHLSDSFESFASLEHLTLWASNLSVSPEFFSNLAPLPLVSVIFRGPPNDPLVRHMIDFVRSGERPVSLETLGVDVDTALWLLRGGQKSSPSRTEEQAKLLQDVCNQCGVSLCGTIQQALAIC